MNQERFDWLFEHVAMKVFKVLGIITVTGVFSLEIWIKFFK